MEVPVTLWSVAGNNIAVVVGKSPLAALHEDIHRTLAIACCHQQAGLGADNVLYLDPCPQASRAHCVYQTACVLEPDGAKASMCCNGLGSAVAELARKNNVLELSLTIHVGSNAWSAHEVVVRGSTGRSWEFDVSLGSARSGVGDFVSLDCDATGAIVDLTKVVDTGLPARSILFTVVGEPHLIVLLESDQTLEYLPCPRDTWLKGCSSLFPQDTNVVYLQEPHDGRAYYRCFERNHRETMSCGTGAGASLVALLSLGKWSAHRALRFLNKHPQRSDTAQDSLGSECIAKGNGEIRVRDKTDYIRTVLIDAGEVL